MDKLYDLLYNHPDLKIVGIVLGIFLIGVHLAALFLRAPLTPLLRQFPRHNIAGIVILAICGVWAWFLMSTMDLGEFYTMEKVVKIVIPVGFILVVTYVKEFLAVRSLGTLMLLIPSPFLAAAFLEAPLTRLLIPIICFVWIIVGMFWIGMPYLLRDWITWITKDDQPKRWLFSCAGGAAYGALMLLCAVLYY
ncbi:MAG: hypothetical protein ACI8UO_001228 [Verrucomicrobiales bacterium]|jgi:hypothetical protein